MKTQPLKTLLAITFAGTLAATAMVGCGGGEKKTATPTDTTDTTATPVSTDGDATTDAPDPALVAKGMAVFEENCSTCHGDDGSGDDKTPAVIGEGALADYPSEEALFNYTKESMPGDDPGGLSDDEYKAVVAFIRSK